MTMHNVAIMQKSLGRVMSSFIDLPPSILIDPFLHHGFHTGLFQNSNAPQLIMVVLIKRNRLI